MTALHDNRNQSSKWIFVAIYILGFLVLYVLSTGPYVWCVDRGYLSSIQVEMLGEMVYLPLILLYDHSEWCEAAFDWYFAFWILP